MISTDRPIVYKYTNTNYSNSFKEYKVRLSLWNTNHTAMTDVTIYTGRTWFDSNGETTLLLSTILRDHTFSNPVEWDTVRQVYKPKNFGTASLPIEDAKNAVFYTATVKILVNGIQVTTFVATEQSYSAIEDNGWNNPYDGTVVASRSNNPFNMLPHVPNISTENIWVGLNYAHYGIGNRGALRCGSNQLQVGSGYKGNYCYYIPMSTIYNSMGAFNLNNEYETVYFTNFNGQNPIGAFQAFVLDNCPKDYYLLWDNSYGTFSWGCSGKTYVQNNQEHTRMTDIIGADKVLWSRNRNSWTVNTGMLTEDERAGFTTLLDARNIWLYDTGLDKIFNVTVETNSLRNIPDSGKMSNLTLDVKEIIQHID